MTTPGMGWGHLSMSWHAKDIFVLIHRTNNKIIKIYIYFKLLYVIEQILKITLFETVFSHVRLLKFKIIKEKYLYFIDKNVLNF